MNSITGNFTLACALVVVVLAQGSARGSGLKKPVSGPACRPKELILITKLELESCLSSFENVNGKHLDTWSPGFPELTVHQNALLDGAKVQCSLFIVAQGLEQISKQQKMFYQYENSLKKQLRETTQRVEQLGLCLKHVLGGECFPKPSLPEMPKHTFERKQWGHALLKAAKHYTGWLYKSFMIQVLKVQQPSRRKHKEPRAVLQKFKVGRKHLL